MLRLLKNVRIVPTMKKSEFEKDNSLRSPRFTYNLLVKSGPKKCALCGCGIPELLLRPIYKNKEENII